MTSSLPIKIHPDATIYFKLVTGSNLDQYSPKKKPTKKHQYKNVRIYRAKLQTIELGQATMTHTSGHCAVYKSLR